jgi:hypothetical protein
MGILALRERTSLRPAVCLGVGGRITAFGHNPVVPKRPLIVVGILLPFVAVGVGLLVPRSVASSVLIPATFVLSGALIVRWWAFVPSIATAIGLSVVELVTPVSRYGTATEIHAGGFDIRFLLLTSTIASVLAMAGAAVRLAIIALLLRVGYPRLPNARR